MFICSAAIQTAQAEYVFQTLYEFPSSGIGPKIPACRLVEGNDGNFYGNEMVAAWVSWSGNARNPSESKLDKKRR